MHLSNKVIYLSVIAALFLLAGCVSIDPVPFEKFNASLVELNKGVTASVDVTIPMMKNRYRKMLVSELEEGNHGLLNEILIIANKTDPFYVSPTPVFMAAQQFKIGIYKINMVWLDYSNLLVQLSSQELVNVEEFEQMSTKLNQNALNAIRSVMKDTGDKTAEGVALFSEVAVGFAKEFINKKQKDKLIRFITENQNKIESYVAHMQSAVVSMAQISTQEHSEKQHEFISELINLVNNNSNQKENPNILKIIDDIIEIKRTHSMQMGSLQALHSAYGRIPGAHKALAENLKKSDASLGAISALLEKGVQMYASYEATAKFNKAELVQAKADAASNAAKVAELKYQHAELKASRAQFDYVLAQNALNADPDNEAKKKDVESKKAIADAIRLEADKLKESAVALRAAATAIRESAYEVKYSITTN